MPKQEIKKLYRSKKNRVFLGVCGGIGEYANIDPVVIRVFWVVLTLFTGLVIGILAYFLCAIVIPENPK